MGEFADRERSFAPRGAEEEDPWAVVRRLFRRMCATVAVAVVLSACVWPWRVTAGLLLGGLLSLLNFHWLRTSVAAVFGGTAAGARPKLQASRYVLRYIVVALIIGLAHRLDLVSLGATLAGMCSFVVAALFEGFTQLYFAVVHERKPD